MTAFQSITNEFNTLLSDLTRRSSPAETEEAACAMEDFLQDAKAHVSDGGPLPVADYDRMEQLGRLSVDHARLSMVGDALKAELKAAMSETPDEMPADLRSRRDDHATTTRTR